MLAYNEPCMVFVGLVSMVSTVSGVSEVSGGVECRGCRAMSMCFDNLDTHHVCMHAWDVARGMAPAVVCTMCTRSLAPVYCYNSLS